MYPSVMKLLRQSMAGLLCSIISVVNYDLSTTGVEEIPDQLLAPNRHFLSKFIRLGALLA